MSDELRVIRVVHYGSTWFFTLSDGTNARRGPSGKTICLNPHCVAKRENWDCRHSTAAALLQVEPLTPVEKC